ncbi:hypothetical protein B0H13DRAFT_1886991 [Mycena leptocephala]|nr:hypothetical protein B0H13DRAFT_1886991 [Mycena leptocephala]
MAAVAQIGVTLDSVASAPAVWGCHGHLAVASIQGGTCASTETVPLAAPATPVDTFINTHSSDGVSSRRDHRRRPVYGTLQFFTPILMRTLLPWSKKQESASNSVSLNAADLCLQVYSTW